MKTIPLFKVRMPKSVDAALSEILHSGYVAEGEAVREFETKLATFLKVPKVIALNSCTSALHLSLHMTRKRKNGYVITTPMTCLATNVSIINTGQRVVWADVDPMDGMMTGESLKNLWKNLPGDARKQVNSVLFVLWGGNIGDIQGVHDVCNELGIPLIIDAAQGLGAYLKDERNPLDIKLGDYVCYSFQAIKHITTGDGGALVVNDPDKYKRAFDLKWFGIDRDGFRTPTGEINWDLDVPEVGFKFHMNNIAATIGIHQLKGIKPLLARYTDNAAFYYSRLIHLLHPSVDIEETLQCSANWVYTGILTKDQPSPDEMVKMLQAKGIIASRMHVRNDIYSGLRGQTYTSLEGLEHFNKYHICLPCGPWVGNQEKKRIVEAVGEILGG